MHLQAPFDQHIIPLAHANSFNIGHIFYIWLTCYHGSNNGWVGFPLENVTVDQQFHNQILTNVTYTIPNSFTYKDISYKGKVPVRLSTERGGKVYFELYV